MTYGMTRTRSSASNYYHRRCAHRPAINKTKFENLWETSLASKGFLEISVIVLRGLNKRLIGSYVLVTTKNIKNTIYTFGKEKSQYPCYFSNWDWLWIYELLSSMSYIISHWWLLHKSLCGIMEYVSHHTAQTQSGQPPGFASVAIIPTWEKGGTEFDFSLS